MLSRNIIILIILIGFNNCTEGQILEPIRMASEKAKDAMQAALLSRINATEVEIKAAKTENNLAEMESLTEINIYAKKQKNLTDTIYKHYKQILEAAETVSSAIRTYKRCEEFYLKVNEIMELYGEYGINLTFYSLYDLDKYINPEQHTQFINSMQNILKETESLIRQMNAIIFEGKEGVKASDYERYKAIKTLDKKAENLLFATKSLINRMIYLIPYQNYESESVININKNLYNYNTYGN